jgi:4-diphosphocytidyl-2-C-methyl-D-erythritol kinase
VGRRADGYHLLQSPFVLIDWSDTLHFETRDDGRLVRHDLAAGLPADDLCLRAAQALQRASGTAKGADISIVKRVPWGAGLGGGSSDAASTLLALNRLWGLNWTRARLAALGLALGADVPFFIGGQNAFVEGIGESLMPIDVPAMMFAVVKPHAAISTRDIFTHPMLVRDTEPVIVEGYLERLAREPVSALKGALDGALYRESGAERNDLQGAAEAVCTEVGQVARWLQARYGNSRMTGSGSAVFARLSPNLGTAEGSLVSLPESEMAPGWTGRVCRSLAQHPLRAWAD